MDGVDPFSSATELLAALTARRVTSSELTDLYIYIHSRWTDEPAFERHAGLAHRVRFVERVGH